MGINKYIINTASSGINPGLISCAAIVAAHSTRGKEFTEFSLVEDSTLPKSELKAVILALQSIPDDFQGPVTVFSSSRYLVNGYIQWRHRWIQKDFRGFAHKALWLQLAYIINQRSNIQFNWVKARSTKDARRCLAVARLALEASS